jgi:hypothetical protein
VNYKDIADKVAQECKASDAGVVVTVNYWDSAYQYCIWAINNGKMVKVYLLASCTSKERLTAHVRGFCENNLRTA